MSRETTPHGWLDRGLHVAPGLAVPSGRFGRMFPGILPRPDVQPHPAQAGAPGGPMDSSPNPPADNPRIAAGWTFFGQFVDHDVTFDPVSAIEREQDPNAVFNFRTPFLELDSVYGAGPNAQPVLYDRERPGALLVDETGPFEGARTVDLPRSRQGTAIIGDPRNDENLILSQMHAAFLAFHNAVLAGEARGDFETAARLVRWHYQWIVLNEFLPLVCGDETAARVRSHGRRFYRPAGTPFMPVEFSVGAYRFGHSQVRGGYQINRRGAGFTAALFPGQPDAPQPGADLRGSIPVPAERAVDWGLFFDLPSRPPATRSLRIDTKLSAPLLNLPTTVVPPGIHPALRSLATRNLQRHLDFRMPAGPAVAHAMGIPSIPDDEFWTGDWAPFAGRPAPLWLYVLREAELLADGQHLGPAGGTIVAEVITGLLELDPSSFLSLDPGWRPTLGTGGAFGIADLLRIAGVA